MTTNAFTGTTVKESKAYLRANFEKGCICPSCNGVVKLYNRPITAAMAVGLILIYRKSQTDKNLVLGDYIHIETLFKEAEFGPTVRADVPKLRFWGLLERKPGEKKDGNPQNGYYRITKTGIDFVKRKIAIPSHVKLYNDRIIGFSEKMTDIHECLKKRFNYDELLKDLL